MTQSKDLRAYQSRLLALLGSHFADGCKKVALVSPTGSGKSLMVTTLLARLAAQRTFAGAVVCVPQSHIKDSFDFTGIVRDYGPDDERPRKRPVITDAARTCEVDPAPRSVVRFAEYLGSVGSSFAYVCTHAALARTQAIAVVKRAGNLSDKLLVIDEGHHSTGDTEANTLSKLRDAWLAVGGSVLLVTATPFRTDGAPVLDDTWTRVMRSMAEHTIGGIYAPEHLECRHRWLDTAAKSKRELDDGVAASAQLVKQIVRDWAMKDSDKHGRRPKTIVIVPQNDSQQWTMLLAAEFRRFGARVFDATGADRKQRDAVRAKLTEEAAIKRWSDSSVDVMLGCKRFDEGTDWPLCSHVHVIGYPLSINTTIQRWGRATRSKSEIVGHPFPGVASITFYNPAWSNALSDDLKRAGKLSLHRETSHLLAAHTHDWETGQEYAKAYAKGWVANRRSVKTLRERAKIDIIEQAIALDASETARAIVDIDKAKAKLGIKPDAKLYGAVIEQVIAEVERCHGKEQADAVAQMIVERCKAKLGAKEKALDSAVRALRLVGQRQSLVRKEMRAKFRTIINEIDAEYSDGAATARLADVARWNGEQIRQLTERMRFEASTLWGAEYEAAVADGARKHLSQTGKRPPVNGDSSSYVGFSSTWQGIDSVLRQGSNGVGFHGGLNEFLDRFGIGEPNKNYTRSENELRRAILDYYNTHKRAPGYSSMKVWGLWCTRNGLSFADIRDSVLASILKGRSVKSLAVEASHARRAALKSSTVRYSLAWWMAQRSMTANKLAKWANVCKATVLSLQDSRRSPNSETREKLASALGLKAEQIKWDVN